MYYTIDGKLVKSENKKIKEDFLNIPFLQFVSAKNAGLKSTKDIESENDVIVKGDINLEGKMIKGGKEINLSKLNSDNFNVPNLNVDKNANIKGNINLDGNLIKDEMEINFDKYWDQNENEKNIYYNGNVGIGTTNPKNKFHVVGNVRLDLMFTHEKLGTLTIGRQDANIRQHSMSFFNSETQTKNYMAFNLHNGGNADASPVERMRILGNGNIGVGTINPESQLELSKSGGTTLSIVNPSGYYSNQNQSIEFKTNYATTGFIQQEKDKLKIGATGTNPTGGIKFYTTPYDSTGGTNKGNNTRQYMAGRDFYSINTPFIKQKYNSKTDNPQMMISGNGNVSIGTTSSDYRLKVNTSKNYDGIVLFNSSKILAKMGIETDNSGYLNLYKSGSLKTSINSKSNANSFINNGGNVGIGNSNPAYKLDVNGDIRIPQKYAHDGASSKLLFYSNPGFGEAGINFVGGALYNEQGSSYLNIFVRGVNAIAIQSGGNVGIGTSKPSAKLHVNVSNSSSDKSKLALNVYKDFNGVDNGNYAARIYALDHKIKETGIRICEKGGSSLKSSSTKVLDVYSNGSSVMTVGGDGKLTVKGGTGNVILGDNRVDLAGINDEHNGNDYAFIQRGNHGHPRFKNGSNKIPAGSSGDLFMINGDNYDNDIHIFATGGSKYYTKTGGTGTEGGRVILSNIINHSDNRIKHNEVTIPDALINIRKLKPKKYFKTNLPTLYPENHNFEMKNGKYVDNNGNQMSGIMECGLIAQEVEKIPFFESSVKKPKNEDDIYGLNYTNIFVTTLAALKELDMLHTKTKQDLANEKLKVSSLEARLSALEKKMLFNN